MVLLNFQDRKIHIYNLCGNTLREVTSFLCGEQNCKFDHAQEVLDLKYSPDGSYLAAVGSEKNVVLFQYEEPQHMVSCFLISG